MTPDANRIVFLRAIADAPDDDTPRLVYADWLDEHGATDADRVRAEHPGMYMFGEAFDNEASHIAPYTLPENGGISVLDFPMKEAMVAVFGRKRAGFQRMDSALYLEDGPYANPYDLATFYDNHDMRRLDPVDDSGFIDAHNWLFTARGIPVVYYGSEVGFMRGHVEHALSCRNGKQTHVLIAHCDLALGTGAKLEPRGVLARLLLINAAAVAPGAQPPELRCLGLLILFAHLLDFEILAAPASRRFSQSAAASAASGSARRAAGG